ncbi:MAG: xanthine dehydrogenase family protein subunit M [Betaproteobacteria bacterium]|nr:xanthine dehydrogenase family protein subunit M [Betaproteobacteria bacterium]
MKPASFDMKRPAALDEVLALLAANPDARILAGGQSLVPMMNLRMATPPMLIDVNRVPGLDGIFRDGNRIRIGAMTRQREILASGLVASDLPLLAKAAPHIGHVQTRARGTFGGSLAHADPSAELVLVMKTLGADVHVRSTSGERAIPAGEFFRDALTTALAPGELLVAASIPAAVPGTVAAFREYARRKGDFAIASAAVQFTNAGRLLFAGVGGVGAIPHRCLLLEKAVRSGMPGRTELAEIVKQELESIDAMNDQQASGEYRRCLGMTALMDCLEDVLLP